MPGHATLDIQQSVAIVTIENAGRLNAIDEAMATGLADAVARVKARSDLGALILRGAGREAFCSGADLKFAAEFSDREEGFRRLSGALHGFFADMTEMTIPTIAMMHGVCYGGGVQLAVTTDFRFADTALRFAIPAVKLGRLYPLAAMQRLHQLVGPSRTRRIFLEGKPITAETLLGWGLLDELAAPDALEAVTLDFARHLAAQPRSIVPAYLRVLRALDRGDIAGAEKVRLHAEPATS
jgi:enoyl-CoA hydratase/carnithine racemase